MGTKVLIIDDEPINRFVLEQLLQAVDCETSCACDGGEALEKLSAEKYELVLLDIHMPKIDGFAVVRQLRSVDGPNRHVPVAAVTADTSRPRESYLAASFNEYLNKPVQLQALSDLLKQFCGGQGKVAA